MTKTLMIGLDAACWEYLDPLLARGVLPTLKGLMEAGLSGRVQSTLPAHTPTAWASIITGKNPGKHGVFDMVVPASNGADLRPTTANDRRGSPFWRRLNERGLRVGLVNVPFNHPPEELDGFVVCGFGSPESSTRLTYPADLLGRIEREFGPYRPTVSPEILIGKDPAVVYRAEREHQRQLVQIAARFAVEEQVDVLVMNLMLLDHANHKMPSMDLVEQSMVDSDADIEHILGAFQPETVLLFSDHGSRRVEGTFLLDAWLRDRGYAVQRPRSRHERVAAVNWILVQQAQAGEGQTNGRARRWLLSNLLAYAPRSFTRPLWRSIEASVPFALDHARFRPELDMARSAVSFGGTFSGLLYLNRAEATLSAVGSVSGADTWVSKLVTELVEIEDPSGSRPLLDGVYLAADLYQGPAVSTAPAVVLDTYSASCNVATNFARGAKATARSGRYHLEDAVEFGHHSRLGMFVFSGPPFPTGKTDREPTMMDLAPLLLTLHDVPVPDDYDGHVPVDLLEPDFAQNHPPSYQTGDGAGDHVESQAYSEQEAAEVLDHLRALGYLD